MESNQGSLADSGEPFLKDAKSDCSFKAWPSHDRVVIARAATPSKLDLHSLLHHPFVWLRVSAISWGNRERFPNTK